MKLSLLLTAVIAVCHGFDPLLDEGLNIDPGMSRNPGFKVEVTKAGVDYVKEFSVRLLSREIPKIPLPPEMRRDLGDGRGNLRILTPKIADFRPPKYYDLELSPPNRLKWLMRAIQVRVTGGFDGTINALLPVQLRGLFEVRINDMSFDLVAELYSAPTGQPFIKVDVCHAGIHSMDVSISEVGAVQELAFKAFRSTVSARLRPVLTTELCRIITELVNVRANRILLGFPTQIPVTQKIVNLVGTNANRFTAPEGSSLDFGPHIPPSQFGGVDDKPSPASLILDYRLIDPPSTANNSITTHHLGEISWFGRGKTPFYPHPMIAKPTSPSKRKMLRVFGSDFVANSLLYHAHHRGIFRFRVNPDTVRDFKPLLKTSCPLPGSEVPPEEDPDYFDYEEGLLPLPNSAPIESAESIEESIAGEDFAGASNVHLSDGGEVVDGVNLDDELAGEFGLGLRERQVKQFSDSLQVPRISALNSDQLRTLEKRLGPGKSRILRRKGARKAKQSVRRGVFQRNSVKLEREEEWIPPTELISRARGVLAELELSNANAPPPLTISLAEEEEPEPKESISAPLQKRRELLKDKKRLRNRRRRLLARNRRIQRQRIQRRRQQRRTKRQASFGGFSITHNNEAFLPFCLGDFLPGISDEFPNEALELRYKSNAPPTFFFKRGEARIKAHGSLFLSLFPKPKFLFHAFTNVEIDVKLNLTDPNRVVGNAEVSKLELKLTRSRLPTLSQESLDFISDLTRSIINDLTTDIMQQGIPLPTVAGFDLRQPNLSMHPHYAVLESDFEFDEDFLAPLLRQGTWERRVQG